MKRENKIKSTVNDLDISLKELVKFYNTELTRLVICLSESIFFTNHHLEIHHIQLYTNNISAISIISNLSPNKTSLQHTSSTKILLASLNFHHTTAFLFSCLLAIPKSEKMRKPINQPKKLQNSRANLILQPLQQFVKHANIFLPNRNRYIEIDLRVDNIPL